MFHMSGEHTIFFDDFESLTDVHRRPNVDKIMFTEWLKTNKMFPEARRLTYVNFPTKWVCDKGGKSGKL